jgi:hypothetical protein
MQVCELWEKEARQGRGPAHQRESKEKPIITIGRVKVTSTGVDFPDDLTKDEWLEFGRQLFSFEANKWFYMGDLLFDLEKRMSPLRAHDPAKVKLRREYRRLLASIKRRNANKLPKEKVITAEELKTVAERIPPALRHPRLSWEHHKAVSRFADHDVIARWLDIAEQQELTPGELWRMSRSKTLA